MPQEQLGRVPEFIIKDMIDKLLDFIRTDYAKFTDKTNTFLYRALYGNSIEKYTLAEQAVQVFIDNDISNPRFLEVHLMFNMQREGAPTIHITLPSEQTQTGGNGIGFDEGYNDSIFVAEVDDSDGNQITASRQNAVFTRRFQSTYNIVITSDNSNEVILIYHTLRALLISASASIHLAGLEGLAFGGQDVQLFANQANKSMYVRAISVTLSYETSVPNIFDSPAFKEIFITGTPINE